MSKSKNNFITTADMLESYPGDTFRMFALMHHYRSPVDYSVRAMETAKKHLRDIGAFLRHLGSVERKEQGLDLDMEKIKNDFYTWLDDDFNTPAGLAVIFELMNKINQDFSSLGKTQAVAVSKFIKS